MSTTAGGARQGILSLAVKDKAQLYAAYMPYLKYGGIFVPTPRRYFLGDEAFVLLTLPESSERLPVAGKVVWVTPRSEEHTSELQSLMRTSYAVFRLKQKNNTRN